MHCCVISTVYVSGYVFSVLPGRKFLNFQNGAVQVELSFSALFSNVLVVFGTVRNTNALAQECTLLLESEPVSHDFSCLL